MRLYRACPEQWESEEMEVVSYGYRVTAQKELR